jgi:hypothetical protein
VVESGVSADAGKVAGGGRSSYPRVKEAEVALKTISKAEVRPGDVLAITGHRVGEIERTGEILEVLGTSERRHFLIRWDDGHESIYYPGNDASILRSGRKSAHAKET